MQRVGPGRQIHCRTNCRHSAKLRWTVAAPLPRQLQNQIAAHGKPNQHEARNSIALDQVARHRRHIGGTAGVVKRRRHNDPCRRSCAGSCAPHSCPLPARSARCPACIAIRSIPPARAQRSASARSPLLLPVTVAEHGNAGFHLDQALFGRGQIDSAREEKRRREFARVRLATRGVDGRREGTNAGGFSVTPSSNSVLMEVPGVIAPVGKISCGPSLRSSPQIDSNRRSHLHGSDPHADF